MGYFSSLVMTTSIDAFLISLALDHINTNYKGIF